MKTILNSAKSNWKVLLLVIWMVFTAYEVLQIEQSITIIEAKVSSMEWDVNSIESDAGSIASAVNSIESQVDLIAHLPPPLPPP